MGSRWRLAVVAGLFTLVTACGGGGGDGGDDDVASISGKNTPTSTAPREDKGNELDKMRAYAKCMRENGVDVKDPDANGGGIGIAIEGEAEKKKVDTANEKCKAHLPNGGEPEKPTAEQLDEARAMAKCLREHGIDVREPTMDDPGIAISGSSGEDDKSKVDKAMEECSPEGATMRSSGGGK
jgi:hypothetical protein